ncbi:apolipoprotein N-acyltransferase [Sphingomicrobium flavum]|uniref:apolipoprotein N-acyltransferase n=1 Tax=Sphingomicrobium flavum TaxID=1229164 RepID=UPI0021ADA249|nr:apolipoprotein N-acyltransferase [Sphingomicrobium flavum]
MKALSGWLEGRRGWATAFAAGLLSAAGFEPIGWWPLTIAAFAILAELLLRTPSLKGAAALGWFFGLGQFLLGLNWIATAFSYQDAMPAWLGWVGVVLLSIYLAAYPALAALGAKWAGRDKTPALIFALAGAWAIGEFLRGTLFTGFAWNPVAVALVDMGSFKLVPWVGTYGLSVVAVLIAGICWLVARRTYLFAFLILAFIGTLGILPSPRLLPPGNTVQLTIVQPNIDQADKWRPGFDSVAAERLLTLSNAGKDDGPRIILWPEAAVTDPLEDERTRAAGAVAFERARAVRALGDDDVLITGGIALQSADGIGVGGATNSIFALSPDGRITGRYDKSHLVPYGEYLPMRALLEPIGLSRLAPGAFDFSAGPGPENLDIPGIGLVGMQICYEIIFPGAVIDRDARPRFLFNPSNDAWFGSFGPPQHLAQARLRAAEEAIPIIRATPTGISAVIDARGQILDSLPWREAGIIDSELPWVGAPTLFSRLGNWLSMAFALLLFMTGVALRRLAR